MREARHRVNGDGLIKPITGRIDDADDTSLRMTLLASGSRRIPRLEVVDDLFASLRRCFIPGCSELVLHEPHGLCDRHRARLRVLAPQIVDLLAQDLADSNPDDDATARPLVPLNEMLVTDYAPCSGMRVEPDGGIVMTFSEPSGNLLLNFERSEAIALLSDLAETLGFTRQRRRVPPDDAVEPSLDGPLNKRLLLRRILRVCTKDGDVKREVGGAGLTWLQASRRLWSVVMKD